MKRIQHLEFTEKPVGLIYSIETKTITAEETTNIEERILVIK